MPQLRTERKPVVPSADEIVSMTQIFRALSDESRLRILLLLDSDNEYSVSEIAEVLGLTQSNVSHHLIKLDDLGFVGHKRHGKRVYYYLKDDCVRDIMRRANDHVRQ